MSLNLDLSGRCALVCGATRGIGRACAEALAGMGATLTLAARSETALRELALRLPPPQTAPDGSTRAHDILAADFSDPQALAQALDDYRSRSGRRFHILVNNTGGPPAGPVATAGEEAFRRAFDLHLVSNHVLMRHLLGDMKEAGYGRIINVISTSVKQPLPGLGVSNTVRAAVANWAKTLAGEVASFGITVNNVLPGATATERLEEIIADSAARSGRDAGTVREAMQGHIPAGRFAEPAEIAAAVAFLASPSAAYITGINLPVDGGRTACL
jgi:3-oxoacyl-[acyl-carrier protein] reductase